jgi:FKBP-type peptidyl-prolyl cis-trans isomerase
MATSKAQRIGIIIIALVMTVGTVGSFFIMIIANQNSQNDAKKQQTQQAEFQKKYNDYMKEYQAYKTKFDEEGKQLSPTYYAEFSQYKDTPAPFDGSKVKSLDKKDLKEGTGAEVKQPSDMRAYYIGWNEKGKVFDGSIDGESLKAPIDPSQTIPGWQQGIIGMKIGGVRELTIPSNLAYGEQGQGADIPKNAPLKFILMAVPPSELKAPQMPDLSGLTGAQQ